MALQFGNNLGNALGAEMQAYLDRTLLQNLVENSMFDRFATIRKVLPQHKSKQIEFRKWIRMADLYWSNHLNKQFTGNVIDLTTNRDEEGYILLGKNEYSNFILPEGSSGTSKGDMKRIKVSASVFPIGDWISYTEELTIFDDMWSLRETSSQMGEMAGLIIDAFYRDLFYNGAGHRYDITGNGDGHDSVVDEDFANELRKAYRALTLSGARPVSRLLSASVKYGTVPVNTKYIAVMHTVAADVARDNPKFVPVEKYTERPIEGEVGTIGMFRIIESPYAYMSDNGDGTYNAEILIFGQDHTAQIPLRGKKRVEFVYQPLGSSGSADALKRVGTVGWKSWLGAKVLYPERLAVINAKVKP